MITKKDLIDAWVFLRKYNQSIPDDVLDFILDSSTMVLENEVLLKQLNEIRLKRKN